LPIAAGGFIYIATSDLIPVLHEKKELSKDLAQGAIICLGIGSMILLTTIEQMIK
jgi:zinc and cadmium transporter